MRLVAVQAQGFFALDVPEALALLPLDPDAAPSPGDDRQHLNGYALLVGASGAGKSNILRTIKFFLSEESKRLSGAEAPGAPVHWREGGNAWDPACGVRCVAALHFELDASERALLTQWRVYGLLRLLSAAPEVRALLRGLEAEAGTASAGAAWEAGGPGTAPVSPNAAFLWDALAERLHEDVYAPPRGGGGGVAGAGRGDPFTHAVYVAASSVRDPRLLHFSRGLHGHAGAGRGVEAVRAMMCRGDEEVLPREPVATVEAELAALAGVLVVDGPLRVAVRGSGRTFGRGLTPAAWASVREQLLQSHWEPPAVSGGAISSKRCIPPPIVAKKRSSSARVV